MAIMDVYLSNIAAAVYGSEMRSNIYNALSEMAAGVVDVVSAVEAFQAAMPDISYALSVGLGGMVDGTIDSVDLPVSTIRDYAFKDCRRLKAASFPSCSNIGYSAFDGCVNLSSISFPSCMRIGGSAFYSCSSMTTASFPSCRTIESFAFQNCRRLESVYFLGSSVPTMTGPAFSGTPMAASSYVGHYGSIYVLASLVSAFQKAAVWSYYSSRITAYNG